MYAYALKCRRGQERKEIKDDSGLADAWFTIHDEVAPSRKEKCKITDYSEDGLGICTNTPLEPGKKITFIYKRKELHLPDNGIVMWTIKSREGYRAGIRFVK